MISSSAAPGGIWRSWRARIRSSVSRRRSVRAKAHTTRQIRMPSSSLHSASAFNAHPHASALVAADPVAQRLRMRLDVRCSLPAHARLLRTPRAVDALGVGAGIFVPTVTHRTEVRVVTLAVVGVAGAHRTDRHGEHRTEAAPATARPCAALAQRLRLSAGVLQLRRVSLHHTSREQAGTLYCRGWHRRRPRRVRYGEWFRPACCAFSAWHYLSTAVFSSPDSRRRRRHQPLRRHARVGGCGHDCQSRSAAMPTGATRAHDTQRRSSHDPTCAARSPQRVAAPWRLPLRFHRLRQAMPSTPGPRLHWLTIYWPSDKPESVRLPNGWPINCHHAVVVAYMA